MVNRIVANSALNAAAGLSLLLVGFICSIITARLLGPEANGIIAFSLWLAVTASLVAELGTGVMLLRLLPQLKTQGYSREDRRGFAAYLLRPVLISTIAIVTFYGLFFWLAEREHWATSAPTVVIITGILLFVQSIGSFTKNYLLGEQNVAAFFRLSAVAGGLQLLGVLAGALFFGIPGALAGYTIAFGLQFLYSLGILKTKVNRCGISARYLVGSSALLSMQFVVDSIFLNRVEFFFLQQYQGIEVVGFYAVAFTLANLALQLPVQLSGSLVPYYSEKLHAQDGQGLPVEVFEGVVRSLSYVTLPMSFGLAAIAPSLVTLVFGEAFASSGPMLTILALGVPAAVYSMICTQYLFSLDRIRERLMVGIVGAIVMVVGDLALVPHYGGEGAALVRIAVFVVMSLLMMRWMQFAGSLKAMVASLARVMLAALACGAVAYGVIEAVAGLAGLVLAIPAGALAYFVALKLLRAVPAQDREAIESIAVRLPGPLARAVMRLVGFLSAAR